MFAAAAAVVLWAGVAWAVSPVTVEHATEADFANGTTDSAVVTSEGQVQLGRELSVLVTSPQAPAVVSALAADGKTLYIASGSDNAIYRYADGKCAKFASPDGTLVSSLLWTGKELIAGTSGAKGAGVYSIDDKGVAKALWTDADVQYVWAVLRDEAGTLYAATGPKARVYAIEGGKGQMLYEAAPEQAKNILCLARGEDGTLYAGTDVNGLVVQIDPKKKTSRVLLDTNEKEVAAIVTDGKGGLYAATSDAAKTASEGTTGTGSGLPPGGAKTTMPATTPTEPAKTAATRKAATTSSPSSNKVNDTIAGDDDNNPAATSPAVRPTPSPSPRATSPGAPPTAPTMDGPGNAVYHIDADGLARAIFRRPVSIYTMVRVDGALILGTGNNGQIFRVSIKDDNEVITLADAEPSQVTALAMGGDGQVYFGTANKGSVGAIAASFAKAGTFTSKAIDAQQIARWGTARLWALTPKGASVTVSTRTGNVTEPNDKTWSEWSAPVEAKDEFIKITSPAGRFLQYRLALKSDGTATPAAGDVRLVYQVGNLAPEIAQVVVAEPSGPQGGPAGPTPGGPAAAAGATRTIVIQASDANSDTLTYTIEYREVGTDNWIKIADKLDKPMYAWDTQTVGDGSYELRITASDAGANPPATALVATKITKPVHIDNTAPEVKELAARVEQGKEGEAAAVVLTGQAADGGRIDAIAYSLDSATEWVTVLPEDGICDSNSEKFTVRVKDVKPGKHRLTVRATDAAGNTGYKSVTVNVGK